MRDKIRIYCDSARHDPEDPKAPEMLNQIKDTARTVVHTLQSLGVLHDATDRPLTIESLRRQGLA